MILLPSLFFTLTYVIVVVRSFNLPLVYITKSTNVPTPSRIQRNRNSLLRRQIFLLHVSPLVEEEESSSKSKSDGKKSSASEVAESKDSNRSIDEIDDPSSNIIANGVDDDQQVLPIFDWDPSGSIGSLLMQMQKKEEELKKLNKTLLDKENSLDLSSSTSPSSSNRSQQQKQQSKGRKRNLLLSTELTDNNNGRNKQSFDNNNDGERESSSSQSAEDVEKMDYATAKELDDSVIVRISSTVGKETKILELPSLYEVLMDKDEDDDDNDDSLIEKELPLLSRPSHYEDRIGRDMRHLAVSIASCVNDVDEWRLFCEQLQPSGGLTPLIECIQEGAACIRDNQDNAITERSDLIQQQYEESFLAASNAFRALRDICDISLDLAAVIADGILRADVAAASAASKDTKNSEEPSAGATSIVDDFVTLLKYAEENTDIPQKRKARSRTRRRIGLLFRNKRKRPSSKTKWGPMGFMRKNEERMKCKLYITQLLLAMACSSDSAVDLLRSKKELRDILLRISSYNRISKTRRWLRYPGEILKSQLFNNSNNRHRRINRVRRRPFIEATTLGDGITGKIQGTANQVLAAIGYNQWVPKIPGQKGLRILCLDGGGSRGMTAVTCLDCLIKSLDGVEAADCFDLIVGTSTGAIIAFLVALKKDTSTEAVERYDDLIGKIFNKSALSTPLLLFTTATYDESPFMDILSDILEDYTMLDSRSDPATPYVFAVTSKMSSNPTHVALFRNYNYNGGELPDPFLIQPEEARENLGLPLKLEGDKIKNSNYPRKVNNGNVASTPGLRQVDGSRHPGSFRVLQRYALRASTAAPTVFKPVMMGGEMYCDGGIVASNPTAIGIHEARNLFPDIPIELVVSIGTGGFTEQKSAPRIGWDGIIGQIVGSATDAESIHHILEDILGEGGTTQLGRRSSVSNTLYMRFNPVLGMPDEFPIDITDRQKLEQLKSIAKKYMDEPEQKRKLQDIADVLQGRRGIRKWLGTILR